MSRSFIATMRAVDTATRTSPRRDFPGSVELHFAGKCRIIV